MQIAARLFSRRSLRTKSTLRNSSCNRDVTSRQAILSRSLLPSPFRRPHASLATPMRSIPRKFRHGYWPPGYGDRDLRCHRAFTLVELLIVVLIMSIVAAAAAPAFLDSLLFHRVESAARRVKADLEMARQTARLTSAAQPVTFANSSYTVGNTTKSLDDPHAQYLVDLTAPPFELDTVAADFAGGQSVTFDGYGTPSSSGTVVLTTKNHQCTVALDGTTGEVTIASNHDRPRSADVTGN